MKIAPSIKRFGFGAVAALVLTSCLSEMPRPFPTQPGFPGFIPSFTPIVTSPTTLTSVRGKSNRIKYSSKGSQPASITAGEVTLYFRALLAKNGVTTIEATTGVFEESAGTDVIQRAQLRLLTAPTADPILSWPNAPYWSYDMMGLVRGDQVYAQMNVRPSGLSKTEIMRVSDTVKLRPDLRVVSMSAAQTAFVNMPVLIVATVDEANGDVAARANCVLSVNGSAVDQATGILVAAGDVVTCEFAYVFTQAGTYSLSVSATDVSPADWDDANNSVSQEIKIVTPGTPVDDGEIIVSEAAYEDVTTTTREGAYPIQMTTGNTRQLTDFFMRAIVPDEYPAPVQRVDAEFKVGARVVHQSSISSFDTFQFVSGGAQVTCARSSTNFLDIMACTRVFADSAITELAYSHLTGTVTYYGNTLWCNLTGCNTYGGPWRRDDVFDNGQMYGLVAGDQLEVKLTYVDATGMSLLIDQLVPMADASADVNWQWSFCDPKQYERLGTVCMSGGQSGTLLRGTRKWGSFALTP